MYEWSKRVFLRLNAHWILQKSSACYQLHINFFIFEDEAYTPITEIFARQLAASMLVHHKCQIIFASSGSSCTVLNSVVISFTVDLKFFVNWLQVATYKQELFRFYCCSERVVIDFNHASSNVPTTDMHMVSYFFHSISCYVYEEQMFFRVLIKYQLFLIYPQLLRH